MLHPVVVLAAVFAIVAVRRVGGVKFQIWQIMLGGAVVAVFSGAITSSAALAAVNVDVLVFLFGMFVVGHALEESGYLSHLAYRFFSCARTDSQLVLAVIFGLGAASAFLMNDTVAIVGTPLVLHMARRHGLSPKLLLLSLAFAVTIGSVASPIGNPQNLLIAVVGGVPNPFLTCLLYTSPSPRDS